MAQTIPDIPVTSEAWVDLNTVSGIAVGVKILITLKTDIQCRLYEGPTAPSINSTDGVVLTDARYPYATATILAGSLKIWAISAQKGNKAKLSIQEL